MAKLRTNHSRSNSGLIYKVGIFAFILGGLYYGFSMLTDEETEFIDDIKEQWEEISGSESESESEPYPANRSYYLPTSTTGAIINHQYYSLSYSEIHEQPEWVAYELTRDILNQKRVKRQDDYRPDPAVSTRSATPADYRRSGYTRGHLVPAADMAFNELAMSETFYMSNMSPQIRNFNMGVWRELEEQVRDWARKYKHLYIVAGPVLTERERDRIGDNIVTVPRRYYKVVMDVTEPEFKGIGFIIPNEICDEPLAYYATTIDEVEDLTGIDFFPELLTEDQEAELEGNVEISRWKFSKKRYQMRVRQWNNQ